jgi:hypothetical protein
LRGRRGGERLRVARRILRGAEPHAAGGGLRALASQERQEGWKQLAGALLGQARRVGRLRDTGDCGGGGGLLLPGGVFPRTTFERFYEKVHIEELEG